jgi:hypothetical protein
LLPAVERRATERQDEAQQLISRLGNNAGLTGLLFDEQGRPLNNSGGNVADEIEHPPELQEVLQTGNRSVLMRVIEGREMLSIITPINAKGQRRGAFELAQPLSFVRADIARARRTKWARRSTS